MTTPTLHIQPDQINGDQAKLSGEELHHAVTVLRMKPGDHVRIIDGLGTAFTGILLDISREEGIIHIESSITEVRPAFRLTLGMGIVAGDRFEWAVQKATELGATDIIPLITERTEVKVKLPWKRLIRLNKIALSACKQSWRARLPFIHEPVSITLINPGVYSACVVFWEDVATESLDAALSGIKNPESCLAVIGPVGGLTEEEAVGLKNKGAVLAGLGPRVLRTETAVVAAATLLQHRWGDMG